MPVAYSTAYYALVMRGRLEAGHRVLIHAGAGAVGMAAIRICLHRGCEVTRCPDFFSPCVRAAWRQAHSDGPERSRTQGLPRCPCQGSSVRVFPSRVRMLMAEVLS